MANVPGVIDRRTVWRKENIVCVFQRGECCANGYGYGYGYG